MHAYVTQHILLHSVQWQQLTPKQCALQVSHQRAGCQPACRTVGHSDALLLQQCSRAAAIIYWSRTVLYCSRAQICGTRAHRFLALHGVHCTRCYLYVAYLLFHTVLVLCSSLLSSSAKYRYIPGCRGNNNLSINPRLHVPFKGKNTVFSALHLVR